MDRRRYLRLTAAAGTSVLIAGCNDSSGSDDGPQRADDAGNEGDSPDSASDGTEAGNDEANDIDEPSFAVEGIAGPSSVSVGEEFTLSVTVSNDGGAAGTYEDTLEVRSGAVEVEGNLTVEVAPGATETVDVAVPAPDRNEDLRFGLADAEHAVEVTPIRAEVGESVALTDSLRATLRTARFQPSILYEERISSGLGSQSAGRVYTAPTGRALALVAFDVENVGIEPAQIDASDVTAGNVTPFRGFPNDVELSNAVIDGEPLVGGVEIDQGATATVWLLGQAPASNLSSPDPIGYDRGGESPPEIEWSIPGREEPLPDFELESVDAPESADGPYDITVRIANAGGDGTFRGVFQWDDDGTWAELDTVDRPRVREEIPDGETVELTVRNDTSASGEFTYRLAPFERTWETELE